MYCISDTSYFVIFSCQIMRRLFNGYNVNTCNFCPLLTLSYPSQQIFHFMAEKLFVNRDDFIASFSFRGSSLPGTGIQEEEKDSKGRTWRSRLVEPLLRLHRWHGGPGKKNVATRFQLRSVLLVRKALVSSPHLHPHLTTIKQY